MTETPEIAEAGAQAVPGLDPAAIAVALGAASHERADVFLEEQTRLVRLQAEELSHELDVRRWSLWVRHLSGLLKLTFEVGLAIVALGLACFIAAAVWNAAHADGLIIDAFSVPPDLANRGITGQVVASKMLDKLTAMQSSTESSRVGKNYSNSWGDDVKVEIPETGVSIGEAYRFLRRWLGRETHVSGEVIQTSGEISITVRTGSNSSATVRGSGTDLDALIFQGAEHIYRITQPDRYARYLVFPRPGLTKPRFDEARAILNQMVRESDPLNKTWAWYSLGVLARYQRDYSAASVAYRQATTENLVPSVGPSFTEAEIGHPELALASARTLQRQGAIKGTNPTFVAIIRATNLYQIPFLLGDYQAAAEYGRALLALAPNTSLAGSEEFKNRMIHVLSLLHDGAGMRAYWSSLPRASGPANNADRVIARVRAEGELGHYQAVLALEPEAEKTANAVGEAFVVRDAFEIHLRPLLALAKAKTGDIAGAQALIAASPLDCYDCLRIRGLIAETARDPAHADTWFARAVHDAPSIPMAYADWGHSLLERGQADAAIAKFQQAKEKGPHFADPLVYWGEALMAKNQSHLALAKFQQAQQYAPNWGRLHLKWGEALVYAGKKNEARKHFARAAQLDLTPSEKSELAHSYAVAASP